MAFLGLYGAHGCGKTTAIKDLWASILAGNSFNPGTRLTIIHADNTGTQFAYDDGEVYEIPKPYAGRSRWKDKSAGKWDLIADCVADDSRIYLVESARFDVHTGIARACLEYGGGVRVIIAVTSWETMRSFLMARCLERNKTFRSDYWTPERLIYESSSRYLNLARKSFGQLGVPYKVFTIDEKRNEWTRVLVYIASLINTPVGDWYERGRPTRDA